MERRSFVRPAVAVLLVGTAAGLAASRLRSAAGPGQRAADLARAEAKLTGPAARAYIDRRILAIRPAEAQPVQTDPAAPDYDPRKIVRLVGVDVLFRAEPRNDAWASAVERGVAPRLESAVKAIIPEVASVTLECRTTTCAVAWALPPDRPPEVEDRLREVVRQLFPGSGQVTGAQRFVVWENRRWEGDLRQAGEFVRAALEHIEEIEGFLSSPAGEAYLAQAAASQPPPPPEQPRGQEQSVAAPRAP